MKNLTRRHLIRWLVALAAYVPASVLLAAPTGTPVRKKASIRALGPFLDTLLPQDSTPSATQLDVDKHIVTRMRGHNRLAKIVVLGCTWLDQQACEQGAEEFALLEAARQERIVTTAEASPPRKLPRIFFATTRRLAFRHYYAQPASWPGMRYAGPPQPIGYPDHADPPSESIG